MTPKSTPNPKSPSKFHPKSSNIEILESSRDVWWSSWSRLSRILAPRASKITCKLTSNLEASENDFSPIRAPSWEPSWTKLNQNPTTFNIKTTSKLIFNLSYNSSLFNCQDSANIKQQPKYLSKSFQEFQNYKTCGKQVSAVFKRKK